jgi:hypothetical protein
VRDADREVGKGVTLEVIQDIDLTQEFRL